MSILDTLNEQQKEAALIIDNPILILAGAGSGKTKTITTRLAYLINEVGIPAHNTLTLTFTNRAAAEMRSRAMSMVQTHTHLPLLCTFHKFGLLFLRLYMQELGRQNNFIVIDSNDRKKIIRDIISSVLTDDMRVYQLEGEITRFKNAVLLPDELSAQPIEPDSRMERTLKVYRAYEEYLKNNNLVDYDDLLLLSYQILDKNKDIAEQTSLKYRYVMVDEYQDTNDLQNKILDKLLVAHQNICVVGDDDQSIYSWRGANIDYILNFQHKYKNASVIKIEKNYRSTTQILQVANQLIMHNPHRHDKTLISNIGDGAKVTLLESIDDYAEIDKIAQKIQQLIFQHKVCPEDIAILFRLNAFSRSIEEGLSRASIPFKLVGTIGFYERKEIKDYIAYFRLLINLDDSFSLGAIIDRPKREIGKASLQKALQKAQELGYNSLYKFSKDKKFSTFLGTKRAKNIYNFFQSLEELRDILNDSVQDFLDAFENFIPLRQFYASLEDGDERIANIDELYGVIGKIVKENPSITLEEILNEFSLSTPNDSLDGHNVLCMSIHNSKGLEFDHLFVVGLEDGFFPLLKAGSDIQEERRLGYVAFTRAKKSLTLSYVDSRFFKGKKMILKPSRFLSEAGLLAQEEYAVPTKGELYSFKEGELVRHNIFGVGHIESIQENGDEINLKVDFGGLKRDIRSSCITKII